MYRPRRWANPLASEGGRTVDFDVLLPPACRGTAHAEAFYWTQALTADMERGTRVGQRIVGVQ